MWMRHCLGRRYRRLHGLDELFLLIAVILVAICGSSEAQPIRSVAIDSIAASIESASFSDRIERIWKSSRPLQQDNEYGFSEALNLTLSGSVYHPRMLSWSGNTRFNLKQRFVSSQRPDSRIDIYETLQEYRLRLDALKSHPLSLGAYATKNISNVDSDFLTAANVRTSTVGSNIAWSHDNLSQLATYTRSRYFSEGQTQNDEVRSTVRYDASYLLPRLSNDLRYEYGHNVLAGSNRTFTSHTARYSGTVSIDKRRQQNVAGSLLYNHQKGETVLRYIQSSVTANAVIGHGLSGLATYSYRTDRADDTKSRVTIASIKLIHRLYRSLVSSVSGDSRVTTYDDGNQKDISSALRFNYRKETFFGNFTLQYGLKYRQYEEDLKRVSQRLKSQEFVYSMLTPILIDESAVDSSSIQVLNLSRPDRIPQFGFDYIVETAGEFYEIVIPLSSSIIEGDSIQVSYIVLSQESFEFDEFTQQYGMGLSISPFLDLRASRQRSDRSLQSGMPLNPLDDVFVDKASVSLHYWRLRVEGDYLLRNSGINPYKRRQLLGRYSFRIGRNLNAILSTSYAHTDFLDTKERSKVFTVAANAWYRPHRNLTLESRLSNINRAGRRDDGHNLVLRNVVRYSVQMLSVEARFDLYDRKISVVGTEDRTFVSLSIKRTL